jgi:hypothetical protein
VFGGDIGTIKFSGDAGKMEGIILTSSTTLWSPFSSGEGLKMLEMTNKIPDEKPLYTRSQGIILV